LLTVVGDLLIVLDRLLTDKRKKSRVSKIIHKTLDQSVGILLLDRKASNQATKKKEGKGEFM